MKAGMMAGAAGLALLLAGCAAKQISAPTFPTVEQKAEVKAEPRKPVLADAGDARDAWRLRSALNVAALGCTRAGDKQIAPRYNAMLKQHQRLLTEAYLAEEQRYRAAYGTRWQGVMDREATQLYNRFAFHPDQGRFCRDAGELSEDAANVAEADFARFARASLPRLELPEGMMEAAVAKAAANPPKRPAARKAAPRRRKA